MNIVYWIIGGIGWLFIGFMLVRHSRIGEVVAMLDGDKCHRAALLLLIYAVLLWPVAQLLLNVYFIFDYYVIQNVKKLWRR